MTKSSCLWSRCRPQELRRTIERKPGNHKYWTPRRLLKKRVASTDNITITRSEARESTPINTFSFGFGLRHVISSIVISFFNSLPGISGPLMQDDEEPRPACYA